MARELKLDGVQFSEIRKKVDQSFCDRHDSLEEAYYGIRGPDGRFTPGTGWKDGVSVPWEGFDVQANPVLSKALFDRLHGALFHEHHLALVAENERQGNRYDPDQLDPIGEDGTRQSEKSRRAVTEGRKK